MAKLQSSRGSRQPANLVLNNVILTDKILGRGSYGSVLEVIYNHTTCAAKEIHEILVMDENEGVGDIVKKFQEECQLMAQLRHPNITQFLGLFYMEGKKLPLLVMEKMEASLDDVLEFIPNLSLGVKISILEDVCRGLVFLHGYEPPVIHRDLTARNVLLTKSLKAKITDMGNSRVLDLMPDSRRQLTNQPGTLLYMPPEALDQIPQYGTPLDVFSLGHLALYTLTQQFPGNLASIRYHDPQNPSRLIARTELERRQEHLSNLDACIGQFYPALPQLVRQCLLNNPNQRPSSKKLLDHMKDLREKEESRGEIVKHLDIDKLKLAKGKMIAERKLQEEQQRREVAERRTEDAERRALDLERQLQHVTGRQQNLRSPCLEDKKKRNHFNLQWRQHPDFQIHSPFKKNQLAVVQDKVYYMTTNGCTEMAVLDPTSNSSEWHCLPSLQNLQDCALVSMGNKLELVGGYDKQPTGIVASVFTFMSPTPTLVPHHISTWDCSNDTRGNWQQTNTKIPGDVLMNCVAATYEHWLVMVGYSAVTNSKCVVTKLMDRNTEQWYIQNFSSLRWLQNTRSCLVGDTWYIVGLPELVMPQKMLVTELYNRYDYIYSISLPKLIHQVTNTSVTDTSSLWKTQQLPCQHSAPLCIQDTLFLVGGAVHVDRRPISMHALNCLSTRIILHYQSDTEKWEIAGYLPFPVHSCNCTVTSDGQILIIGGQTSGKLLTTSTITLNI